MLGAERSEQSTRSGRPKQSQSGNDLIKALWRFVAVGSMKGVKVVIAAGEIYINQYSNLPQMSVDECLPKAVVFGTCEDSLFTWVKD